MPELPINQTERTLLDALTRMDETYGSCATTATTESAPTLEEMQKILRDLPPLKPTEVVVDAPMHQRLLDAIPQRRCPEPGSPWRSAIHYDGIPVHVGLTPEEVESLADEAIARGSKVLLCVSDDMLAAKLICKHTPLTPLKVAWSPWKAKDGNA